MFTKQHYKAIAKIIRESSFEESPDILNKDNLVERFCNLFGQDNPNFDRDKFFIECYKNFMECYIKEE